MRFAICNELFENWPWEKVCDFARGLGYEGLEVAPFTLADSADQLSRQRRVELRRAAESRGVQVLGLHWLLSRPRGCTSPTPTPPSAGAPPITSRNWSASAPTSAGR